MEGSTDLNPDSLFHYSLCFSVIDGMYSGPWFLGLHVGHIAAQDQVFVWCSALPQYWQGTWNCPVLWLGILLHMFGISLVINMAFCCFSLCCFMFITYSLFWNVLLICSYISTTLVCLFRSHFLITRSC